MASNAKGLVKLVLLGDAGVGKTSLLSRWYKDAFRPDQQQTIGAAFTQKEFQFGGGTYKLQIWDTAGQDRFQSMAPIYSQNARGALLVFDLTRTETLEHLEKWRGCLDNCADDLPIVIAGNKSDLDSARTVPFDEAVRAAQQMNAEYFETSAENGTGVTDAFETLAETSIKSTAVPLTLELDLPTPAANKPKCKC
jgi:small GTP-binding protein